jgi:hypothetical protein
VANLAMAKSQQHRVRAQNGVMAAYGGVEKQKAALAGGVINNYESYWRKYWQISGVKQNSNES